MPSEMIGGKMHGVTTPRSVRRAILPILMIVLLVAVTGLYGALRAQRRAFQAVDHSRDVQRQLDATLSLLKDAETGQRGYLLTDDARDLEPYKRAVAELPTAMATLASSTADNPVQRRLVSDLQNDLRLKLAELSQAIALRNSADAAAGAAMLRSGRGAATMQSFRADVAKMQDEEQRLLDDRSATASTARLVTQAAVATTGVIALLLLWLLYRVMVRDSAVILESEARLAATLESVGDAIIATDVHGCIDRMNPVAERLTGWSLAEARGQTLDRVFQVFDEGARQRVESPFERVMRDGEVSGLANHTVLRSKSGLERPIDDSAAPIRDANGAIVGVVLVFRDVSERYAADRELAESEARFRGTFENAAIGIAHVSPGGRFLRVNGAFLRITGYASDALMQRTFAEITHPDDVDADWAQASSLARGEIQNYTMQKRYRRPDESYVWVNLTVALQRDRHGAPLFYISSIQDISAQRLTELALRESEARFRDIADATPVLIWISDPDKRCIWFNSRWLIFTGRTLQQETGSGWIEGVHPEDLEQCVAVYDAAFERRETYRTEYRRKRADGEWRTLDASGVPRYVDGRFVGYIGSCIDVTEQRSAARSLVHREEQLRLATEAAEIGLWDVDTTSDTLFWPPRVRQMFGIFSDRPVSLEDYYNGLHPDDRELTIAAFNAALDPARRALYDVEYRTVGCEDGVVRWVAAKGRAIFRNDLCTRVVGTAIDITRRKAAESQLRELNEELEQRVDKALAERKVLLDIIEATDARVMVLDPTYRILAINRATVDDLGRLYGGVRAKVGDNLLSLLDGYPSQRAQAQAYWRRALHGEEYTATDEFGSSEGERRHYEMKFNSLRDPAGRFLGAFQFVNDVTARLKEQARLAEAELHLRQTQKIDAIGQLSGGIAHDFNNLLMVISGGLSLLVRSEDVQKRQRIMERMRQAAERGAALSRQLLAFARRRPLHAEPVDLHAQINGMLEILDRTLRGDVVVETRLPAPLWPVLVDPAEFELVVLNLCVNARDAMPKGGTITITATNAADVRQNDLTGDFVVLSVADTGTGMSPETLARVFEPFFTTKELGKGSGLGLAQVYGFAQQSGGAVRLESEPGRGTTAMLWLPRSEVAAPVSLAPEGTGEFARPRALAGSVLMVEDSEEVAALVSEMLGELGYRVTRVASAQAALGALADDREIDIVFSDVMMPGSMNGVELAREIRRRRPGLPVLLTTGYAGVALASAYEEKIEVLAKPYEISELDTALRAARKRRG